MSRYRKIEVKTWADEKFCGLSPMPPSGQGLWLYLMTGPHTGPIPGLFRAGRAGMAEELGWEIQAFDKAFSEVSEQGMAIADFKARLVWLPNALRHNKPESPNVVRSWRVELDLLPECDLKREAIAALRAHLQAFGASYVEAFDEFAPHPGKERPKASAKPSGKPSPNQEQEQEQEQEQDSAKAAGAAGKAKSPEELAKAELWRAAVSLFTGQGMPEPQARAFFGKLAKDYPDGSTVTDALRNCIAEQPADARSWLTTECQRLAGTRKPQSRRPTSHAGLADKDYSQGVTADGTLA